MKLQRACYWNVKSAVLVIQTYYRARVDMVSQRNSYLQLRNSVIVTQRLFKRKLQARREAASLHRERECSLAASILQEKWRARLRARKCQDAFEKKRCSVIKIQSYFRMYQVLRSFKDTRRSVIAVQAYARGYLVRSKFSAALVECRKRALQESCAVKIQSLWRGYRVRKSQRRKAVITARRRIESANKSFEESRSVQNRLPLLIQQLLRSKYLSTATSILSSLGEYINIKLVTYLHTLVLLPAELMTSASRNCAEALSSAAAISALIDLVSQSNRSSASLSIVKTVLKIFLNLCKVRM
jgi:aspartokinase